MPGKLTIELVGRLRAFMQTLDPGEGGGGGQVIAQEIPEVQVPRRRRVQQRTVRFEDVPVRMSLRSVFQNEFRSRSSMPWSLKVFLRSASRSEMWSRSSLFRRFFLQERISKRIHTQTVDVPLPPVIPQERTSERIVEQIVPAPQVIPQKRASKRIAEQIVDAGMGTSSSSAATLGAAECPYDRVFRTLPRKKKSATSRPESSANLVSHSTSWPSAAYAVPWSPRWLRQYWRWIPRMRTRTAGGTSLAACGCGLYTILGSGTCLVLAWMRPPLGRSPVRGGESGSRRGGSWHGRGEQAHQEDGDQRGHLGGKSSSSTGCRHRICTVTAHLYMTPSEKCWLDGRANRHRYVRRLGYAPAWADLLLTSLYGQVCCEERVEQTQPTDERVKDFDLAPFRRTS